MGTLHSSCSYGRAVWHRTGACSGKCTAGRQHLLRRKFHPVEGLGDCSQASENKQLSVSPYSFISKNQRESSAEPRRAKTMGGRTGRGWEQWCAGQKGAQPLSCTDWASCGQSVRAKWIATGAQVDRVTKPDRKEAEETSLGEILKPHLVQVEWRF